MDTPITPPKPDEPTPPAGGENMTRLVRVLAPAPEFLPPLDGEAAMLIQLLGHAFTDLIEGA